MGLNGENIYFLCLKSVSGRFGAKIIKKNQKKNFGRKSMIFQNFFSKSLKYTFLAPETH